MSESFPFLPLLSSSGDRSSRQTPSVFLRFITETVSARWAFCSAERAEDKEGFVGFGVKRIKTNQHRFIMGVYLVQHQRGNVSQVEGLLVPLKLFVWCFFFLWLFPATRWFFCQDFTWQTITQQNSTLFFIWKNYVAFISFGPFSLQSNSNPVKLESYSIWDHASP